MQFITPRQSDFGWPFMKWDSVNRYGNDQKLNVTANDILDGIRVVKRSPKASQTFRNRY